MADETKNNLEINYHATVIEIAGFGILLRGASGSGKSSLALGIVERMSQQGIEAVLVGDDQVLLCKDTLGQLVAKTPEAIAGKVEIFGYGIVDIEHKNKTKVGLIVNLVEQEKIERLPLPTSEIIFAVELPTVMVPRQHEDQSVRIVCAWLKNQAII